MYSATEFERLLAGVRGMQAAEFRQRGALATIVRTHGSTFRRAGSSLLVHDNGGVVCALSGGCPENDIVERAKKVIEGDIPQIARYNDESAGDVLFEAGCGGELDVLIEPLSNPSDVRFFDSLAQMHAQRCAGFMATAYALQDAPLLPRPRRLIWNGNVAWSDIEDAELSDAVTAVGVGLPQAARGVAHCIQSARGRYDVLFETVQPAHALVVIGANPVALALVRCATALGWKTILVDQRDLAFTLPAGAHFVKATPATVLQNIPFDAYSSALAMTFNVERDIEWLDVLADAPLAYLGAIGSRERATRMRAALAGKGTHLYAPAGLDIGSETPEEIALAVSAEILAVLNAREGRSLLNSGTPIHP